VRAAVAGRVTPAWIEVEVLDDGTDLHLSVMDSGDGVADAGLLFDRLPHDLDAGPGGGPGSGPGRGPGAGPDADPGGGPGSGPGSGDVDPARVHGLGFGLPLSRDIARRRGGDVWLGSPGGDGHGAVFCARLVGAVSSEAAVTGGAEPARASSSTDAPTARPTVGSTPGIPGRGSTPGRPGTPGTPERTTP
jgi:two-component system CitB family sensor kinase